MMKKMMILAGAVLSAVFLNACCTASACTGKALTSGGWELEEETLAGIQKTWEKPERDITLVIQPDGKYAGCAGINRYFGSAVLDVKAGKVKFNPGGTTMMMGPGGDYERAYLKMLSTVDSYKICGDELQLLSSGKTVAEFEYKDLNDMKD